nr:polyadenylate-binding protein 4-like [Ipomoea batatas]
MFSKYGTILSCKVAEENGKSKCFGFVQFETQNSAISAISSLNGAVFEGKKLYVSTFKKKEERMMDGFKEQKFNNLYVKNFDCNLTEDLLREKFSRYGKVNSAVIMRDEEGNSRGFGFVKGWNTRPMNARADVGEPENLNTEESTPTACKNDTMVVEQDKEPTAAVQVEGLETEATPSATIGGVQVVQGLEELACKGIDVDQFVDEAVLEAAIDIIEEAAGNVMQENEVNAQQVEGLEAGASPVEQGLEEVTPSPTIGGVNGGGSVSRLKEMVQELRAKGIDISIVSKESETRSIGSCPSLSYNAWAKGMKEKWGPKREKLIDEAKQEVLNYFEKTFKELGQSKYDEMEPQLLEEAGSIFVSKLKEAEPKERGEQNAVKAKVQEGEVCSSGSGNKKKEWELNEWALLLKEKWEQDEDLGDIIDESLREIRAYLRENHGGWLEKFDSKVASEASSILKCKIVASSIGKKYGPKSRLGWGLKCKHLSTGYLLYDWARKYFDGVIDSEDSGSSEGSDEG